MKQPIVFISYAWGDDAHQNWILNLANKLVENDVDVILDQYDLHLGANLDYFVENAIRTSNTILCICTSKYKEKSRNRSGGVGYEFALINNLMKENMVINKIIPVLRNGDKSSSVPDFMNQLIHLDFSSENRFEENFEELLRYLYKEPKAKRPTNRKRPVFGATAETSKTAEKEAIAEKASPKLSNTTEGIDKVKNYVNRGDTKSALASMQNLVSGDSDTEHDLIVLRSRFNSLQSKKMMGIITLNEINVETNRINYAILNLLNAMK